MQTDDLKDTALALQRMREVVQKLLSPDGCPWDREQTPETLCDYLCEEVFELADAVRRGERQDICEEMGDVLFLLLFMAELTGQEAGPDLAACFEAGAAKMIRRHPHVFGDAVVENKAELIANWERIKREEQTEKLSLGQGELPCEAEPALSPLFKVPADLPPLLRAYRLHSKAARLGFTWPDDADAYAQLQAECAELHQALTSGDEKAKLHEFGDVLFTLVEMGRRKGLKANAALAQANARFVSRFEKMLQLSQQRGLNFAELSLDAQNMLWNEAKQNS